MPRLLLLAPLLVLLAGCPEQPPGRNGTTPPPGRTATVSTSHYMAEGRASYHREPGGLTATGERLDHNALTAAHRTLPLGARVRVTNLENQRSVVVRINDRGPAAYERIIDLSREAGERLGILPNGVVPVRLERLDD